MAAVSMLAPPEPLLFFRVGEKMFSLPLAAIREVALPGHMSRIPRAPAALPGVMNLRGRIVVVVDTGLLFRSASAWTGKGTERLLVLDEGRRDLGLLVSEVLLIANLGGSDEPEGPRPQPAESFTKDALIEKIAALLGPNDL